MITIEKLIELVKESEGLGFYLPALGLIKDNMDSVDSEKMDYIENAIISLVWAEKSKEELGQHRLIKILAEYYEYIYEANSALCENSKEQEEYIFMPIPCRAEDTGVRHIFLPQKENNNKHLLTIELPQKMFEGSYGRELIVLSHEIAHYVGKRLRSRENRLEKIFKIYSRLVVLGVQSALVFLKDKYGFEVCLVGEEWEKTEELLSDYIELFYYQESEESYLDETGFFCKKEAIPESIAYNEKSMYHMVYIEPVLAKTTVELLLSKGVNIFGSVILGSLNKITYEEKKKVLNECFEFVGYNRLVNNSRFSIITAFDFVKYLLKDAYADLMSILLLDLRPEDYFTSLEWQGDICSDQNISAKVISRIAVVVVAMVHVVENDKMQYVWDDKSIKYLAQNDNMVYTVLCFIYDFIKQNYFYSEDRIARLYSKVQLSIQDRQVLQNVAEYLIACKKEFIKTVSDDNLCRVRELWNGKNKGNKRELE